MTFTDFWEHLLVSYWDNLMKIQDTWIFLGAHDESFGTTFGPGSTGWETQHYTEDIIGAEVPNFLYFIRHSIFFILVAKG